MRCAVRSRKARRAPSRLLAPGVAAVTLFHGRPRVLTAEVAAVLVPFLYHAIAALVQTERVSHRSSSFEPYFINIG